MYKTLCIVSLDYMEVNSVFEAFFNGIEIYLKPALRNNKRFVTRLRENEKKRKESEIFGPI